MRSRVPPPPQDCGQADGETGPKALPPFLQQSPLHPQPVLTPCPREDWSGARPGSGLSLLSTGASWALKWRDRDRREGGSVGCSNPYPPASHCPPCSLEVSGSSSASSGHSGRSMMSTHQGCCAGADRPETSQAHRSPLNGSLWPLSWGPPGRPPQPHSPPSCPSLRHPICRQGCCPLLCPCPPLVPPSVLRQWVWEGQGWEPGQEVLGSRDSLSSHTLGPRKVSEQGRGFWGWGQSVGRGSSPGD